MVNTAQFTKRQPPTKCIFCGFEGKLTGEHITSKRYHRFIPSTLKTYKRLRSVELIDRSTFRVDKRSADPRDWKVKCVCEDNCNNGWMRNLDKKVDPILQDLCTGQSRRLTQEQQTLVATWAVMKTIVAEYEDPEAISSHHMHRKRLYRKRLPPEKGWTVWIGHYPRRVWTSTYYTAPFQFLRPEVLAKRSDTRAIYYNGAITTLVIGEFFFQVSHAPKLYFIEKISTPVFPDGGMLLRIWPPNDYSLIWPPPPLSDQDEIKATRFLRDTIARDARAIHDRHGRNL